MISKVDTTYMGSIVATHNKRSQFISAGFFCIL